MRSQLNRCSEKEDSEKGAQPWRVDITSNGMPEIGTSPIAVFATTCAVPDNSTLTLGLLVTAANS